MDALAVMALLPGAVVSVFLTTLGVVVLRAAREDLANRAFAAFTFLVAANYACVSVGSILLSSAATAPLAPLAFRIATALEFADPVALVIFAGVYPSRNALGRKSVRFVVVGVAAALEGLLLLAPEGVFDGTVPARWVEAYLTGVYAVAALHFVRADRERGPDAAPSGFALGWAVVAFYRAGSALGGSRLLLDLPADAATARLVQTVLDAASGLALLALAIFALTLVRRDFSARYARSLLARSALAWAAITAILAIPLAIVVVTGGSERPILAGLATLAFNSRYAIRWIFFAVAVGPAILRNQVFRIDARLRALLVGGTAAGVLLVALAAAALLVEESVRGTGGVTIVVLLLLGLLVAAAAQAVHVGHKIAERVFPPQRERDAAYQHARRISVYREALRAVDDKRLPASSLDGIRERLALTREEAEIAARAGGAPSARSPGAPKPGTILDGRYEIERAIGRGSHGQVFLARDRRDALSVAVKRVEDDPGFGSLHRMEREVDATRGLDHPGILAPTDFFADADVGYIVTPYMPGGSLADRLRERGALPPREAASTVSAILSALACAHARGIVHRDVKPANVLFDATGAPRLGDFGIAVLRSDGGTASFLGLESVAGTLSFLPPEAMLGAAPEPGWDVHAAGTLLFACLTGRVPTPTETPPTELPPLLAQVVARARATDPAARFPSADAMREALEGYLRATVPARA